MQIGGSKKKKKERKGCNKYGTYLKICSNLLVIIRLFFSVTSRDDCVEKGLPGGRKQGDHTDFMDKRNPFLLH